ncbi:MAG: DUF2945 domain-containing protein, partial [Cyanobacteria bacterium P01_A01_bin.17]
MSKQLKKGQHVTWSWGKGEAEGKIQEIHCSKITRTTKGNEVTRNGSEDNPALVIEQEDGTEVL